MNRGNTDMTVQMAPATLPMVYAQRDGALINPMRGYLRNMEESTIRDSITPLEEGRRLSYVVERMGVEIKRLSFELRSVDGSRLVESTEITDIERKGDYLYANFGLKDLIDDHREYCLVFIIDDEDGRSIRYYTRVILAQDYHIDEELSFVRDFHDKLFDKEAAAELTTYLESNAQGDNSTYARVDIHSSFQQITWGDLDIKEEMSPIVTISEMGPVVSNMKLSFLVSTGKGSRKIYYRAMEYYRVRRSPERIFLLNYEREMGQIFDWDLNDAFANNKIMLGVTSPDVEMTESDGGNVMAFVNEGRAFSYNIINNEFVYLYGFYDKDNFDRRTLYKGANIKILSVDEGQNVRFMVYGYMNRGRHEGDTGIAILYYNSTLNAVEEEAFIPDRRSVDMIKNDVEQLSYVDSTGRLYLMLHGNVYEINLESKNYTAIIEGLTDESYQISSTGRTIAFISDEGHLGKEITCINLNTRRQTLITEDYNEIMAPLGFMGEDIIYGVIKEDEIVYSDTGEIFKPMYRVCIRNENNEILKTYQKDGIYVTDATVRDNQITLHRMVRGGTTGFVNTADDQILNNETPVKSENTIESAVTEGYETIIQIGVKNIINKKNLRVLTPREVLYEGGREISIKRPEDSISRYYVYGLKQMEGVFNSVAAAVSLAESTSGVVTQDKGEYVWKSGIKNTKNQIMAITEDSSTEERSNLAVCLDTILSLEGYPRNTRFLLDKGQTAARILKDNMPESTILELYGCSLNSILYYVDQDIPVLASLGEGRCVLIIGFNEFNVVLFDPMKGAIYKMGMNDSRNLFEDAGNRFMTYIKG